MAVEPVRSQPVCGDRQHCTLCRAPWVVSRVDPLDLCASLALRYIGRMMRSDNLTVSDLGDRLRGTAGPTRVGRARRVRNAGIPSRAGDNEPAGRRLDVSGAGPAERAVSRRSDLVGKPEARATGPRGGHCSRQAKPVGTSGSIVDKLSRSLPGNVNISIPAGSAEDRLSKLT